MLQWKTNTHNIYNGWNSAQYTQSIYDYYYSMGFSFFIVIITGIIKGDEIMVINGAIVSDLDMMYLESVLQEEQALCMMMR